jgi:zinc D-Ala-D-Ala carboxypeptidase
MTPSKWPYFSVEELTCQCGCGVMGMDPAFMDALSVLRGTFAQPMQITSGYRCPAHNHDVAETGFTGPHTTGKAVDVLISRVSATALIRLALNSDFRGIGIKQHGSDHGRMVHLDMVERPDQIIWTYP